VRALRVVIAEDHLLTREGLRAVLEEQTDVEVAASAGDLPGLLEAVMTHTPDVVITDIRMPPTNSDEGIQAAMRLRDDMPKIGVIVLSQYADSGYAMALMERGSQGRGYLLKERVLDSQQLLSAVHSVAGGGSVIDPTVVDSLLNKRRAGSAVAELTERERAVLREIARGKTNAAIGSALFLSEKSVQNYINAIFAKLGLIADPAVHRRVQAVLLYLNEY
jgi:DNA-binding NarL/FixJ family response regulator